MATAAPAPDGRRETAPPWRWQGAVLAIAGLALVGGTVLRVVAPSPLWLDEALSVEIASLGVGDLVDALRQDGHPSLYYLLLGWWMDVVGDGNGAARAFSAVASLATVPVLWAVGSRRSATVGRIAAVVALAAPYLLRYGTEARMYALLVLLVAAAWLAVETALDAPTPARLLAVAAAVAGLVHTHYWSFWVIGAGGLALLVVAGRDGERRGAAVRVLAAAAIGASTFVVWLPVFLDQLGSTGTPWASRARPAEIVVETVQAIGGNNRFEGEALGILFAILATIGAVGARRAEVIELRAQPGPMTAPTLVAGGVLSLGAAVALATGGAFEARYAAVVVPVLIVLVARGIALLPGRIGPAMLAVVVVGGLAVGVDEARRDRTQAGDVAAVIDADHAPGDVVAFCPDQVGPSVRRALEADLETLAFPRGTGDRIDWRDYAEVIDATPASAFVDRVLAAAGDGDVWLVASSGYRSLDSRCEEIIALLDGVRVADRRIAPAETFERMLLTRYTVAP